MLAKFLFILIIALIKTASCNLALDINSSCTNFSCFQQNQANYLLISGYLPNGTVDPNVVPNLKKAISAQIATVDVFMIPCRGQNEVTQVNTLIQTLDSITISDPSSHSYAATDNTKEEIRNGFLEYQVLSTPYYNDIWIVIQDSNPNSMCGWFGYSTSSNCQFLQNIVTALTDKGKVVGISSSLTAWSTVFGSPSACPNFNTLPLWYVNLDGRAAMDDYSLNKFGGWSQPTIKKYKAGANMCGCVVGQDFYQ
jgi:hypothetical protein